MKKSSGNFALAHCGYDNMCQARYLVKENFEIGKQVETTACLEKVMREFKYMLEPL